MTLQEARKREKLEEAFTPWHQELHITLESLIRFI